MTQFGSPAEVLWRTKLKNEGIRIGGFIQQDSSIPKFLGKVFLELWRFTSSFRPQIINSHTERGDLLNTLIHLLHPTHPKAVRTVHIDKQWITHPIVGSALNQYFFPIATNTETAVSKTVRDQLNKRSMARLLGNDALLINNGIDESHFTSPPRDWDQDDFPAGVPDVEPKIGIIGRLTDQKGHKDLLQAFKVLIKKSLGYLLIIGSGPLEAELKQLTYDLGLEKHVYFLGNRDDVMEILPHLDILVSASLWEGFPTVILEAMSQEVPVIATDISGSCELIQSGSTGILVPPNNPQKLADAMDILLDNYARAIDMGRRARDYASQFTIQNTAWKHIQLYKRLIE
jgi:glycosyltransferase involved in cell wall biosynthesis